MTYVEGDSAKLPNRACRAFLILFGAVLSAWAALSAEEAGTRVLRVCASEDYPMVHRTVGGRVVGFFPEILEHVAREHGWRVQYVWGTWEECLRRLERGEADLIGAIARTPDRERIFDFNREVVLPTWGVLVASERYRIENWDDLEGCRVVVQKGDVYGADFLRLAAGLGVTVTPIYVDEYSEVMEFVQRGSADAGVVARTFAQEKALEYGVHPTPFVLHPVNLHFAVPKGRNADVLAALDDWLARAKARPDSAYYGALRRWLPAAGRWARRLQWLQWVALFVSLGLLGAVLVLFSFRRQLRLRTEELRRTVERLKAGEQRYRLLVEHAPIPIIVHADERVIFANPAAARCVGADRPEVLAGRWIYDFIDPEWQATVKDRVQSLSGEKRPAPATEEKFIRVDGRRIWVEVAATPIEYEGKVAVQVVFQDITTRKEAESALQERTRQLAATSTMLRVILDTIPVRVFWKDRESRYLGCNRPFAEDAGLLTPEDALGRTDHEMAWREQADLYRRDDAWVMEHQSPKIGFEEPQTRLDGSVRVLRTSKVPLYDPDGNLMGVLGCYEDITEQRRTLQERMRLAAAVEHAAEGIVITDEEGAVLYVNPAFVRMTGYETEEVRGRKASVLECPRRHAEYDEIWEVVRKGKGWSGRTVLRKKDGSVLNVSVTISPVRDKDGRIMNFTGIVRDISRELELQRQLEEAQRLESVGQLAGGVAHDFRNILQAQIGLLDFALGSLPSDHPSRADIVQARKCADDAARLCDELLSFGRKQMLQLKTIDVNKFLKENLEMLRRVFPENIEIEFLPGRAVGAVRADPTQLGQVFMNLALNARDAMPEGGRLTIETENVLLDEEYCRTHKWAQSGRFAMIRITDSGCGMDEETQARVFEPFFTTKQRGAQKGTGLGLAVVYGIVRQHDGMIRVYSEKGKGTTFKVYLPVVQRRAVEVDTGITGPVTGGHETVLVAEDNEAVRRTTVRMLERAGYQVIEAKNGYETIRILEETDRNVDVLIADVIMPGLSGRRLYEEARKLRPGLRFIFTSGYTFNGDHARFIREQRLCFLEKPFGRDALLRALREVLENGESSEA